MQENYHIRFNKQCVSPNNDHSMRQMVLINKTVHSLSLLKWVHPHIINQDISSLTCGIPRYLFVKKSSLFDAVNAAWMSHALIVSGHLQQCQQHSQHSSTVFQLSVCHYTTLWNIFDQKLPHSNVNWNLKVKECWQLNNIWWFYC